MERATAFIQLVDEIARSRGRVDLAFRSIRSAHGLTEVENIVLTAVTHAERPSTVPQIGRALGHPRQVVQRAADALFARGLIEWRDNPDHKRARLLVPTAAGTALRQADDAEGLQLAATLTAGLDAALIARVAADLRAVRKQIDANLRELADAEDEGEDLCKTTI
ncbi:MAG: helix-turn-helix domain-containing protein [Sphingobium sp.]